MIDHPRSGVVGWRVVVTGKARIASNSGAVTLGDVAGKLGMLNVACSKCDRRGRLSVAKLIAEHGAPTGCHS
jgi:hypothetical protein